MSVLTTLEEKVDPSRSAVLVIDMQNDFCGEGGFLHNIGIDVVNEIQPVIPNIKRLVEAAREAGTPVIHLYYDGNPEYLYGPMLERLHRKEEEPYCIPGTWGIEFVDELKPEPGELVIGKHRYSGFYGTDLEMRLRSLGVESVILTGTATNNCVDGTGRDAYYNGFYVVCVNDGAAAPNKDLHNAAMATCEHAYGVVADTDEIISIWRQKSGSAGKQSEVAA